MFRSGLHRNAGAVIVRIFQIESMAHYIPLELGKSWLVNNRIDFEAWNIIYEQKTKKTNANSRGKELESVKLYRKQCVKQCDTNWNKDSELDKKCNTWNSCKL